MTTLSAAASRSDRRRPVSPRLTRHNLRPIGDFQADNVRRQHVIRMRNRIESNTRTQDLFVQAVSRMFGIGMDLGYTDRNPAARIARLNDPQSFEPWPIVAHQKFIASEMPQWMRTAYMLGLWTAQREGDILRLATCALRWHRLHNPAGPPRGETR